MELAWSNLNLLDRIVEGNVSWTFKSEKLVRLVVIYWWADMYLTGGLSLRKKKVDY